MEMRRNNIFCVRPQRTEEQKVTGKQGLVGLARQVFVQTYTRKEKTFDLNEGVGIQTQTCTNRRETQKKNYTRETNFCLKV